MRRACRLVRVSLNARRCHLQLGASRKAGETDLLKKLGSFSRLDRLFSGIIAFKEKQFDRIRGALDRARTVERKGGKGFILLALGQRRIQSGETLAAGSRNQAVLDSHEGDISGKRRPSLENEIVARAGGALIVGCFAEDQKRR